MKTRKLIICFFLAAGMSRAASADSMPKFQELYQVLSTNLEGVTGDELDRAAVLGLIHQLGPRVSLDAGEESSSKADPLAETRVFDNSFAYFRVASVTASLPGDFRAAYKQMTETNPAKIKGLVLDLRFAGGFDYAGAAKLADCFLSSEHPLLDWQTASARATLKADAITIPVAILINSQTIGAAEALAAVLRDTDVGLVLGKLRVAVAQVSFGAGKTLPRGLAPDIAINTSLEDEQAYVRDPFKILHPPVLAKTDSAAKEVLDQPRLNEVELIREHNSGEDRDEPPVRNTADLPEPPPVVADPALARALDLLKGLAVVQPNRPG